MPARAARSAPTRTTTPLTSSPAAARADACPTSPRTTPIAARPSTPHTRHPGYAISQIKRKRIEEPFGWMKTIGVLRKTRHRGRALVEWLFVLTAAAYNLIRIPKLLAAAG